MMNKIIFPFFASLLLCLFSSCIQTSPSSKVNLSRDKTVMLHWLDLDDQGIVRLTGNDGNLSKSSNSFTGKAIETFEQSPTKSVSEWKEGKKHGTTTEYFYNRPWSRYSTCGNFRFKKSRYFLPLTDRIL